MKSLQTLIKLQKSYVDEQRVLLLALQDQLAKLENDLRALEREKEDQKELLKKTPELGVTFADYIKHALERGKALEKKRKTTEIAVGIAMDKLTELFEEQKRYEIAQASRIAAARKEEAHEETLFLDEVGSINFFRKQN